MGIPIRWTCLAVVSIPLMIHSLDAQPIRDIQYQQGQNRHALIIGNDAYPSSPLKNPGNDARLISAVLRELGFETRLLVNGTLRQIDTAIGKFVSELRQGDVALLYYAGHGVEIDGENYLIPVDFAAANETDAKYAAYPASRAQEKVERSGADIGVLILDACRNNPFRPSRSAGGGLAPMNSGRGTFIAFATGPGKTADDNPGGANGLFTTELASSLRLPGLTIDQVFNQVRASVYERSSHRQLPWTVSSVIGEFQFAPTISGVSSAVPPKPGMYRPPSLLTPARQPGPAEGRAEEAGEALARGEVRRAIEMAGEAVRDNPSDVAALSVLAAAQYKGQQFDSFELTAARLFTAGGKLTILLNHHHSLTGFHAASITISGASLLFDPLGATECNQKPFEVSNTDIVSASRVASMNNEIFLALRIRDSKNKARLFNFADNRSIVDRSGPFPVVRSTEPVTTSQALQTIANVVRASTNIAGVRLSVK